MLVRKRLFLLVLSRLMGVDCLILLNRLLRELDMLSMVELGVFSEDVTGVVSKLTVLVTGLNATFAKGVVYCRIGRLCIGVDSNAMLFIGEDSVSMLWVVTGRGEVVEVVTWYAGKEGEVEVAVFIVVRVAVGKGVEGETDED